MTSNYKKKTVHVTRKTIHGGKGGKSIESFSSFLETKPYAGDRDAAWHTEVLSDVSFVGE